MAVGRCGSKLMAYQDDLRWRGLRTDGHFAAELARKFRGFCGLNFHLAPPLLAKRDPATGSLRKRVFDNDSAFGLLAPFRKLRGTHTRHLRLHRGAPDRAGADSAPIASAQIWPA